MSTKVCLVKAMVFLVVMYVCESWTIKKAECQRIDAFELWCWRRLLRVPWTASRSNQSILKEISSEYSLEGLMLKLKLQYFGHLMWKTDSFEKTLKARGEGDDKGWDGWMASPIWWTWVWVSSGSWWRTGRPGVLQSMGLQRIGYGWSTRTEFWYHRYVSIQFSSVQSLSCVRLLRSHGLQHTRPPCPSPIPGASLKSCPLSQWCHPTISSSVFPFSSCLRCFSASRSFPMSQFFTSGGQSIGASAWVLPMNIQD